MDLPAAMSPELTAHQSHSPVSWEASSPCADEMQTDSPSNIMTPVPEVRHGMEVIAHLRAAMPTSPCVVKRTWFPCSLHLID